MSDRSSYVYIFASKPYGTLYIGVTTDLVKRRWQHREDVVPGFTKMDGVHILVWFETHSDVYQAMTREKQLKKWRRSWKIELIQEHNPRWRDLYVDFTW